MKRLCDETHQKVCYAKIDNVRCERGFKLLVRVFPHDVADETVGNHGGNTEDGHDEEDGNLHGRREVERLLSIERSIVVHGNSVLFSLFLLFLFGFWFLFLLFFFTHYFVAVAMILVVIIICKNQ